MNFMKHCVPNHMLVHKDGSLSKDSGEIMKKLVLEFSIKLLCFYLVQHIVGRESKTCIFDFYIFQERQKIE